jgi:hypothetical protein
MPTKQSKPDPKTAKVPDFSKPVPGFDLLAYANAKRRGASPEQASWMAANPGKAWTDEVASDVE